MDGTSGMSSRVAPVGETKSKIPRPIRPVAVSRPNQLGSSGGQDNETKSAKSSPPKDQNKGYKPVYPTQPMTSKAAQHTAEAGGVKTPSRKEKAHEAYLARQAKRDAARASVANLIRITKSVRTINGSPNLCAMIRGAQKQGVLKRDADSTLKVKSSQTFAEVDLSKDQMGGLSVKIDGKKPTEASATSAQPSAPPAPVAPSAPPAPPSQAAPKKQAPAKKSPHPDVQTLTLTAADMNGLTVIVRKSDVVSLPGDAPAVQAETAPPASAPPAPVGQLAAMPPLNNNPHIIWRKSPWWRRLIFKEEPSRLEIDRHDNLHIGTLAKHKHCPNGLTTGQEQVIPELQSYLMMSKFAHYSSRKEILDHMEKTGRKYWRDERKLEFGKLPAQLVNRHFITIQKVVDEKTSAYLLAEEEQNISRKRRFRNLAFWKRDTHTTSPDWAPFYNIPQ